MPVKARYFGGGNFEDAVSKSAGQETFKGRLNITGVRIKHRMIPREGVCLEPYYLQSR
jgi:hypothetical protein